MNHLFKHPKPVLITLAVLILLILTWPFYTVPTGSRGVVTRFGKIIGIEQEGLAILPPWEKLSIFSIRAETATVDNATGATSDTQPVDTSLTVRYSITPNKVAYVFEQYSHDGDLSSYVATAVQEVFKAVTAKYVATDLISKRQLVSNDIQSALQEKLNKYGAEVLNIDMRSFDFSKDYMEAINEKVTQEQKRLAAENKVLTIKAEQQTQVVMAQAAAQAQKAKADGDAYMVEKAAAASAQSIEVQGKALLQNPMVLELKRIQVEQTKAERWSGDMPTSYFANLPMPFFKTPQGKEAN